MPTFARRLAVLRRGMGIADKSDFAMLAGIPTANYLELESGAAEPTAVDLASISALTGATVDFLVTGTGLVHAGLLA